MYIRTSPMITFRDWEEEGMVWMTPKVVEIAVGLEINSYVCAEL